MSSFFIIYFHMFYAVEKEAESQAKSATFYKLFAHSSKQGAPGESGKNTKHREKGVDFAIAFCYFAFRQNSILYGEV